jgi:hypothetical protein
MARTTLMSPYSQVAIACPAPALLPTPPLPLLLLPLPLPLLVLVPVLPPRGLVPVLVPETRFLLIHDGKLLLGCGWRCGCCRCAGGAVIAPIPILGRRRPSGCVAFKVSMIRPRAKLGCSGSLPSPPPSLQRCCTGTHTHTYTYRAHARTHARCHECTYMTKKCASRRRSSVRCTAPPHPPTPTSTRSFTHLL